jgi:hypothetical protein
MFEDICTCMHKYVSVYYLLYLRVDGTDASGVLGALEVEAPMTRTLGELIWRKEPRNEGG